MANGTKRIVKAEDFWAEKEALATAFEAGTDDAAKVIAAINEPEEAVVEA